MSSLFFKSSCLIFNRASRTSRFICRVNILAFHWQKVACLVSLVVKGKLLLLFILVPPILGSSFSPLAVFSESFFFWNTIFCDCKLRANKSRSNLISWSASSTAFFSVLLSFWLPDCLLGANIYYHKYICVSKWGFNCKILTVQKYLLSHTHKGKCSFFCSEKVEFTSLRYIQIIILYAMSKNLTK